MLAMLIRECACVSPNSKLSPKKSVEKKETKAINVASAKKHAETKKSEDSQSATTKEECIRRHMEKFAQIYGKDLATKMRFSENKVSFRCSMLPLYS
jgi:hypothetical protein